MRKSLGILLFLFVVAGATGQSEEPVVKWERIGQEKVSRHPEYDSLSVDKGKDYRAIKLRVVNTGVIIEEWTLEYRDGSAQHVGFVGYAPAGKDFPPVAVNGSLKKIRFRYYALEGKKGARVEVLGLM